MRAWLASIVADLHAMQASWSTVRGGWKAAREDAAQLYRQRRIMVKTCALVDGERRAVLLTRVRLIGDTQTDILAAWLDTATPEAMRETVRQHFDTASASLGGLAAALAMERIACKALVLAGSLAGIVSALSTLRGTGPAEWPHLLLTHRAVLWSLAFAALALPLRWGLRWALRAKFRRGLGPPPHAAPPIRPAT